MTTRIATLKKFHDGDALDDSELADMLHLYGDAEETLSVLEQVEPGYKFALQNASKNLERLRAFAQARREIRDASDDARKARIRAHAQANKD